MNLLLIITFVVGYAAIAFEHPIKINKTASALLTGVICWIIYILSGTNPELVTEELYQHVSEISGILFFLLGAMTIVELVDAHDGFEIITRRIATQDKLTLLWIISFVAFFLSSVLDNLTTTIVMVSLLRKLIPDRETKLFFAGMVIVAANAGGAWTPIGDVTTTMLWIAGKITTGNIMIHLILPSLICLLLPLGVLSFTMKGKLIRPEIMDDHKAEKTTSFERNLIFGLGIGALIFVPIFKTITHLPPFMGMLFGLGILWVVTEIIHKNKNEEEKGGLSVAQALRKVDVPSVLFFLGILIAISALESTHILAELSQILEDKIGNLNVIVIAIGLLSAIIDNVPLVAAGMGMYDYPTDHYFWSFLAYCAGTGGSCLIIGSAAGVAAMGMEKIDFIWYFKRVSLLALLGYLGGAGAFMLQHYLFS